MAESYRALSVAIDEDLKPLAAVLARRGVMCKIFEEGGRQVVLVQRAEQAGEVQALYKAWREGEVRIELTPGQPTDVPLGPGVKWSRSPVTVLLALFSIAGFAIIYFNAPMAWVGYFTFNPFTYTPGQVQFHPIDGQYWRLVTPVFLHFGWLHITFNCLWLWELGNRIEQVMGHFNMFMLFLVIAVVSNASQFLVEGPSLFGGMSGVVYGLLGFSWVAPILQPAWSIQPSRPIMLFMVGWLVVCMLGIVEVLGFGAIANAAHLGGLLCGGALGAVFGFVSRSGDKPPVPPVPPV